MKTPGQPLRLPKSGIGTAAPGTVYRSTATNTVPNVIKTPADARKAVNASGFISKEFSAR